MPSSSADFAQLVTSHSDALDGLSAFLTWRELLHVAHTCSAVLDSRLRLQWLQRTRVVLPPLAATCDAFSFSLHGQTQTIRYLTIAHTVCLQSPTKKLPHALLTHIEQLTIDPHRFSLPQGHTSASIDILVLASTLPNLQELTLSSIKDLVDIKALAQLQQLRRLDLSSTSVQDLSPLAGLRYLHYLDLTDTSVTTLAPLQNLPDLQTLVLDVHPMTCALAPLAAWPRPPAIRVKSVRGHGDVARLETHFLAIAPLLVEFTCRGTLSHWRSSDNGHEGRSSLLTAMQNVESLSISNALLLYRLDMLATLTRLRVLHLSTLRAHDLSSLAKVHSLEELSLTSEACLDLAPLAFLPRLRSLYCHGGDPDSMDNDGHDFNDIELRSLQSLDASNHYLCRLRRLEHLEGLSVYVWSGDPFMLPEGCAMSLSKLRLSGDVSLREIHTRFPRLRFLELQQCASFAPEDLALFSNLESLTLLDPLFSAVLPHKPMPQLRRLCLRGPNIKRISSSMLTTIPNLRELDLEKTAVDTIPNLFMLPNLQMLNLKDTNVCDVSPLLTLQSLVRVVLPKRALCAPLVTAYHNDPSQSHLREVLHPTTNCLWGPHWRQRPRKIEQEEPPEPVENTAPSSRDALALSDLVDALNRCSLL